MAMFGYEEFHQTVLSYIDIDFPRSVKTIGELQDWLHDFSKYLNGYDKEWKIGEFDFSMGKLTLILNEYIPVD